MSFAGFGNSFGQSPAWGSAGFGQPSPFGSAVPEPAEDEDGSQPEEQESALGPKDDMKGEFSIPKRPFQRIVREIAQDYKSDLRFLTATFDVLHEGTEKFITAVFHEAALIAEAKGRAVQPRDLFLARRMLGVARR